MRRLIVGLCAVVALGVLIAVSVGNMTASAYDPVAEACTNGGGNSVYCTGGGGGNPLTGDDGVLIKIANVISVVAGVAAVIMIILAGLRFVTSGNSSEDINGARRTIIYAVVGLVVIALSRALIGLILSAV